MTDTIDTLRAQLAEARRELVAKEAERAAMELERNNAQRQHTMQCAINKTDSQRILELTSRIDKLTAENELLREQRNRVGLYIDHALRGGQKDDHEAGLSGRMDAIRALRTQLAEAQRERDKAIDLLETMFSEYENGTPCYIDPEEHSGFLGHAFKMDDLDFNACCDLLNRTRPRAAIDAAKGESDA